jgi:hypothetical protein
MDLRTNDERMDHIIRLRGFLAVCPTDLAARCQLAALLEEERQYEDALFNWRLALSYDPNSLVAREGFARCRRCAGF